MSEWKIPPQGILHTVIKYRALSRNHIIQVGRQYKYWRGINGLNFNQCWSISINQYTETGEKGALCH